MPSSADPLIARFEHIGASRYVNATAAALYELKLAISDPQLATETAALFSGWLDASAGRERTLPLLPLGQYCTQHAVEVNEFSQQGRSTIKYPKIYEKRGQVPIEIHVRRLFSALIENCLVFGRSSIIRVDEILLSDYTQEEIDVLPIDFRVDPIVFKQCGSMLSIADIETPTMELDEAINLVGVTSCAFGHLMIEYLPKYFLLRHQGKARGVPILIDSGMAPQHREALEIHAAGANPIIEVPAFAPVRVKRLWVASTTCFIPMMPQSGADLDPTYLSPPPETIATLFSERNQALHSARPTSTGSRLFLARHASLHRRMINHAEIIEICERFGFNVIYPDTLSFAEQLERIQGADFIVGPDGSALMTVMHAMPGTKLLILNHPFLENLPALTGSLEYLGVDAQILEGECVRLDSFARKFSDYRICPDDLRSILRGWNIEA